jgi:hypothetical protein
VNGSPDDHRAEERNKLRLALATFALQLDAFEARLKIQHGQRQTPKSLLALLNLSHRGMRQRLLMFLKPNPITHVDKTGAEWASPGVLGFAQRRPTTCRPMIVPRSLGSSMVMIAVMCTPQKIWPRNLSRGQPDRRGVHPPAAIQVSYRHSERRCQTADRRAAGSDWLPSFLSIAAFAWIWAAR